MDIDGFLDAFITGDYFLVFLALVLIILVVLIIALIKTREDYVTLLEEKENSRDQDDIISDTNLFDELLATNESDVVNDEPLIKQIYISIIKTYDDVINEYQFGEEENAIISAEELSKYTKKREEELGPNVNQVAIEKYEEEQENKAIISYEQLLKNAANISLSYKEEKHEGGSPKVNKIEVHSKEVTGAECYLAEEEFLKILKEFRIKLE